MSNNIFNDNTNIITAPNQVSFLLSYDLISPYVIYEHTIKRITSLIKSAVILNRLKDKYTILE